MIKYKEVTMCEKKCKDCDLFLPFPHNSNAGYCWEDLSRAYKNGYIRLIQEARNEECSINVVEIGE